jgi:Na+-driven multidrug efflux pump
VAWVGAGLAAAVTGGVGLLVAIAPGIWLGNFTSEPDVLAVGERYLRLVGPTYGGFGLGLALYFASQGSGRLLWPLLAACGRLAVAAAGGWLAISWPGVGLDGVFAAIALSFALFGGAQALAINHTLRDHP